MRRTPILLALPLVLLMGRTPAVQARVILQPAGASTAIPTGLGNVDRLRDQSGLSAGYTSGVTDFDAVVATTTHDLGELFANGWVGSLGHPTGIVDFDLGGMVLIQAFALWQRAGSAFNQIRTFDLIASDDAAFTNPSRSARSAPPG